MKLNGPGIYDDACTLARYATGAQSCLLMVINGKAGNGFSFQTDTREHIEKLPAMLRLMAQDIEEQNNQEGT
jgi:hypothetical protein